MFILWLAFAVGRIRSFVVPKLTACVILSLLVSGAATGAPSCADTDTQALVERMETEARAKNHAAAFDLASEACERGCPDACRYRVPLAGFTKDPQIQLRVGEEACASGDPLGCKVALAGAITLGDDEVKFRVSEMTCALIEHEVCTTLPISAFRARAFESALGYATGPCADGDLAVCKIGALSALRVEDYTQALDLTERVCVEDSTWSGCQKRWAMAYWAAAYEKAGTYAARACLSEVQEACDSAVQQSFDDTARHAFERELKLACGDGNNKACSLL